MRAFRESNTNTGVDILTQAEYDAIMMKDPKILYIIGTIDTDACTVTVADVRVGDVAHDILVNNNNIIVWMREAPIDYIMDNYHTIYHEEMVVVPFSGTVQNFPVATFDTNGDPVTITVDVPFSGNEDYTCMINVPINSFYIIPIPLHQLV